MGRNGVRSCQKGFATAVTELLFARITSWNAEPVKQSRESYMAGGYIVLYAVVAIDRYLNCYLVPRWSAQDFEGLGLAA